VTSPTQRRSARRLLGAAIGLAVVAAAVFPLDAALGDALRLEDHGRGEGPLGDAIRALKVWGKGGVLALVALAMGAAGRRRRATQALVAMAVAGTLVGGLRYGTQRERPAGNNHLSFPSGDAAGAAAFAGVIAAGSARVTPALAVGVAAVSWARVAQWKHHPSDVLAGVAVGLATAAAILVWLPPWWRRVRRRWFGVAALAGGVVWLAVALDRGGGRDFVRFLWLWAPALALVALAPWIRAWARRSARRAPATAPFPTMASGSSPTVGAGVQPARGSRKALGFALLLVVVFVLALIALSSRSTLWDRDEPRYAQATVEMLESGDWLVPHFNGEVRPDKPPLVYWLMSLPVRVFGPHVTALRAWSGVGAGLACLLTFLLGRRLLRFGAFGGATGAAGTSAAGLGAAALATTPLLIVCGTAATTDAVLLAFLLLVLLAMADVFAKGLQRRHLALMALGFAGALLQKGPIGLAVPVLAALCAWGLLRFGATETAGDRGGNVPGAGGELPRPARAGAGALAGVAVAGAIGVGAFLAWAIPADAAAGGAFVERGLGHHVVGRVLSPLESHGGNLWVYLPYYLGVILVAFFPWTLLLPGGVSALAGRRLGGARGRAVLLGWALPTLVLLSLVATKLPHYVLPIWPALALMVGGVIVASERGALSRRDRVWLRRGRWLFAPVGLAVGGALVIAPWWLPVPGLRSPAFGAGLVVLAMTALALREHRAGRLRACAGVLVAGMVLFAAQLGAALLPAAEGYKASPEMAQVVRAQTHADVRVWLFGYGEPSLIFHLQRGPVHKLRTGEQLRAWARAAEPGVVVASRRHLARLGWEPRAAGLVELGRVRGFNYAKGRWVELVALARGDVWRSRRTS
jgi:4-amino-4-deoxy-L-arabinose transferase-like glycosyltransferase/membrane-associated phospholipid phosphatase